MITLVARDDKFVEELSVFKQITTKMTDIFAKKRHDYGQSTRETYDKFGMVSFLVRMHDKLSRLDTLVTKELTPAVDESIDDTLLDLANYCVIALLEKEIRKNGK